MSSFKKFACTGQGCFAMAAALCLAASASAEIIGPGLTITARDAAGNVATVPIVGRWEGDNYIWASNASVDFIDPETNVLLGQLNPLNQQGQPTVSAFQYVEDPVVNLTFSVQAGPSTTTFSIGSALLTFPTINPAQGSASAAYSVTDFDGDGATLTGIGATGGGYLAQYNGWAAMLTGTTFAEVLPSIVAGSFASVGDSDDVPNFGMSPIGVPVNSMSSLVSFTLSANDLASGTTNFIITPEPASLSLLALGLALVARRRS